MLNDACDACGSAMVLSGFKGLGSGGGEQRIELAGAIERLQVVTPAYVLVTDPDLRDGALAAFLAHFGSSLRLEVDAHLVDRRTFTNKQTLGRDAVRTGRRAAHQDLWHDW